MLSVYVRHSTDCPKKDDIQLETPPFENAAVVPSGINGTLDGKFIRKNCQDPAVGKRLRI